MSKSGRPLSKVKKVKVTLRFRPEFAEFIRRKARTERMPQVMVCETALAIAGKGIKFTVRPINPPKP